MSYRSELEKLKVSMKKRLPEDFHPLVDEYGPALLGMGEFPLIKWAEAVLSGKSRTQKRLIREQMTPGEVAATIKKEHKIMLKLHHEYASSRAASDEFLAALTSIAYVSLSAWLTQQIGVPVSVTPVK